MRCDRERPPPHHVVDHGPLRASARRPDEGRRDPMVRERNDGGRSIATSYALASVSPHAPRPAPYPVQRGLTQALRDSGINTNDINRIQAWAGQSAALARPVPARQIVEYLWEGARQLLE